MKPHENTLLYYDSDMHRSIKISFISQSKNSFLEYIKPRILNKNKIGEKMKPCFDQELTFQCFLFP